MSTKGIVRKTDQLGRVVIPSEMRECLGTNPGSFVEFFEDGEKIILKKYDPSCVFCGEVEKNSIHFLNKNICVKCAEKLNIKEK